MYDKYYGKSLVCSQCKRNFVSQKKVDYYGNVVCTCSWCGNTWEITDFVKDECDIGTYRYNNYENSDHSWKWGS